MKFSFIATKLPNIWGSIILSPFLNVLCKWSFEQISEGERITLALWFSRDASHDEDANLLRSLSNCSLSSHIDSIASCFPMLASSNMYWFPPEEASRFQTGFNICSARLYILGFGICFSDNSDEECQLARDSCSKYLKLLEEPLYLTCGDELVTREFVNILHALQVSFPNLIIFRTSRNENPDKAWFECNYKHITLFDEI